MKMEKRKLILCLLLFCSSVFANIEKCSYEYGIYNVNLKKSIRRVNVSSTKDKLDLTLVDKIGCTICAEDQVEVVLDNGVNFRVCKIIAKDVLSALNRMLANRFPIESVVGYRPQMSRGKVDRSGNRTLLSNHSFGTAIDINPKHNGLYGNCIEWGDQCRLRIGGPWKPKSNPFSIKRNGMVVSEMQKISLRWGGELFGRQKDFMHFSIQGN